ncbi:hypothetical protein FHX78_12132 [Streptomyces capillispiralis]|uniref:Uncharacterized protein n=1 Tax=Streptomyces capillispiralis TaxID=68182 RepID=A0A561SGW1_9ACTN|nr:hypothetical protein FHX78_12132 [Streptomyces capillispiralis]
MPNRNEPLPIYVPQASRHQQAALAEQNAEIERVRREVIDSGFAPVGGSRLPSYDEVVTDSVRAAALQAVPGAVPGTPQQGHTSTPATGVPAHTPSQNDRGTTAPARASGR